MKILKFVIILCFTISTTFAGSQVKQNVVAHRGAWKAQSLPHNSIASLKHAIELNVNAIEFDVRITADDSLVVIHDPVHAGLKVEESNYYDLEKFKLENGELIPTLWDFLAIAKNDKSKTVFVCEIKPSPSGEKKGREIASKVMGLVNKLNVSDKMVYISFDFHILEEILKIDPTSQTQYLKGDKSPRTLHENNISGIDYHYKVYEEHPEWIDEAKGLGLALNVWTVNSPKLMDKFLEMGFDYITTDEPEVLAEKIFLKEKLKEKKLVWQDEFDYDGLPDSSKWSFDIRGNEWSWGNDELQWYTDSKINNAEVSNGTLKITAIKEPTGKKQYSSARLRSLGKGDFKYGYFEISAKMPKGTGTWPAIWMLPSNSEKRWPEGGEIDIMEHVGFNPDTIFATVHTKAHNHIINTQVGKDYLLPSAVSEFNVYSLFWDEEVIKAYVNGVCYFTYEKNDQGTDVWPFDNEFHILLNLAIGGGLGGKKGVDDSLFPHVFEVDYVRVYQ